jgi:hypothetical protein
MPLETHSEHFDKRNVQEARRMTAVGQGRLSLTVCQALGLYAVGACSGVWA